MSGFVIALVMVLRIEGGSCPAAAEVDAKLTPLLSPGFAGTSTDVAAIVEDADGLSVSLARPDGKTVARRRVPRTGTCAEQAETVAVMLAVWEAQIHPEIALRLDHLHDAPPSAPVARPGEPAPALRRSDEQSRAHELAAAVGASVVGAWDASSVAPGARIDATLGAAGRPWRARLSLAALGNHTLSLPPGEASWWRTYLALGADHVLPVGRHWQIASGAAGVLGVMTAAGSGFSTDRTTRSTDLGVEATLRAELRLGSVRPWLGLALLAWLRRQTLDVTGEARSTPLPRLEPWLGLGADFCWRP